VSDPSPERLRRARARGEAPVAHRLTVCAQLAASLAALGVVARTLRAAFEAGLARAVTAAGSPDASAAAAPLADGLLDAARASAPVLAAALAATALAHLAQTRFLAAWPARAAGRGAGEVLLTALWGAAVALAVAAAAWGALRGGRVPRGAAELCGRMAEVVEGTAWRALLVAAPLAVVELLWRRWRFHRAMTPTREEALRERREREGDPRVKAERLRAHRGLTGGHGA
jgi:flagellar biosynthesis protein FlhB